MSELRVILGGTVTRLFTDLCTKEMLENADAGEWPEELWTTLAENGLLQPLVPEEKGGVGAGWEAAYVILHAAGKFAAPVPLAETVLAGWLLDKADLNVPEGAMTVVPESDGLSLVADGADWRLGGAASNVPWAGRAEHFGGVLRHGDGLQVYCAPADAASVTEGRNIAREARDEVVFNGSVAAGPAPADFTGETVKLYGALVRSAQMTGALERILADTVQYTQDRTQFGRPIGKFQVIQQNLSVTAADVAAAVMAAQNAYRAAAAGSPELEAATAKIVAGEAAGLACDICHQTHGAIGFTYEHHLHFFTRRLWSWRAEFGSENEWAEYLGRRVTARGADALWPDLTARQAAY